MQNTNRCTFIQSDQRDISVVAVYWLYSIYVKLTTGPVPPNRPIPTNGPILLTGPIVSSFPTNGPIFTTTRPTFKRHFHKWAERNV